MRSNKVIGSLLVVGSLLVIFSPFVRSMGGSATWSEADARELQQAAEAYHDAIHSSLKSESAQADRQAARDAYEQKQRSLQSSQTMGRKSSRLMLQIGSSLLLIGMVLYLVRRANETT